MNMNLNVYAPMFLCLVPLVATFLLLAILVPGISVLREFLAALAGLVAFVPIVILQFLLLGNLQKFMRANLFLSIIHSLIFFGLIEEGMKAASLLILKSRGETLRNFFAYSILAGMALGCFESVVYLLTALGTRPQVSAEFLQMIFLRMATALVIHTLCAGLGGLCVFCSKNIRRNFAPLVFAILIHGIYDFFAAFNSPLKYFSVAVILLAVLECRIFYLRIRENLDSQKSSSSKNFDSEKTIEIPKSPALVISVKGGKENSSQQIQKEEKMFFEKNAEEGAEDFEKIQKEAEAAVKAEEKKVVSRKSENSKNDSEKTVVKNSAPKKFSEKTAVKKVAEKSSTTKNSSKKNSTKISAKNSSSKISTTQTKSISEKKSIQGKASSKRSSIEKTTLKKSASNNSAGSKKSTSDKKTLAASSAKKSKGEKNNGERN
uniref:Protease PrsW n=1 Tax=uncultured Spirochaetaceae bacterium TaxID=201186 RepID=A0A650EQA8_9SPIO|nr:hypothetical protein Unknown280_1600 [uncultured Spirochaetaceae bacterium]